LLAKNMNTTTSHLFLLSKTDVLQPHAISISSFSTLAAPEVEPEVSSLEAQKDEIMKEIRIATHDNIQEILDSAEPSLKEAWEKALKQMEQQERRLKKNSSRASRPATAAATTSLLDLLDPSVEDSLPTLTPSIFPREESSSRGGASPSLLDLLDTPIEGDAASASTMMDDLLADESLDDDHVALADVVPGKVDAVSLMDLLENEDDDVDGLFSALSTADIATTYGEEDNRFEEDTLLGSSEGDNSGDDVESSESLMDLLMDESSFETFDDEEIVEPPAIDQQIRGISTVNEGPPRISSLADLLDADELHDDGDASNNDWLLKSDGQGSYEDESVEDLQSYNSVMSRGIALLTSMTDSQWRALDRHVVEDETNDDDDETEDEFESADGVEEEFVIEEDLDDEHSALYEDFAEEIYAQASGANHEGTNEVLAKLEVFLEVLLSSNGLSLTTEEYNIILLQLASTSGYSKDGAIALLMQVYSHMTVSDRDGFTHAIMIPTLVRRGQAPIAAAEVILDMITNDQYVFNNSEALIQAMMCLERCNRLSQAEQLIRTIMNNQDERITVPVQAINPLMRMYKAEQKMDEAMDLIDDYIQEAGLGHHTNELFSNVINWPRRNAQGERVNILTLQTFLFNKLKRFEYDKSSRAKPNNFIWQKLIGELAKSAPKEGKSTETELVQDILWLMLKRNPSYWPNGDLLKYGLEVAARHSDAKLAVELLHRLLAKPPPSVNETIFKTGEGMEDEVEERPAPALIPPQAFLLAMQTCVTMRDSSSVSDLLMLLGHPDVNVPRPVHLQSMNQAVRVFASASNWSEARVTLTAMKDRGLQASDEALGAMIHSLAVAQRPTEALEVFCDIESGQFGDVKPGILSFNAKMLALMQMKSWQDVIDLQEDIKSAGLVLSSVAFQGVILASMKLGDKSSVLEAIETATKSHIHLNRSCFEQSIKCLFPELVTDQPSIKALRLQLREFVDTPIGPSLTKAYLNLSRALRVAEVEEERESSKTIRQEDIDSRRKNAWEKAHASLVKLYREAR
jgi:hypothetical protein